MNQRDIAIRTILGEAANEGPVGQAAVLHVLRNRAADPRWPSGLAEVALQPKQFSAWNAGAGGNDLVNKYGPGADPYEKVGAIYDSVMSGQIPDPTGGATHYYSPAGMSALVDQGAQTNHIPGWLQEQNQMRGSEPVKIGGHIFTGLASGNPYSASQAVIPDGLASALQSFEVADVAGRMMAADAPAAPQMLPMQAAQVAPSQRNSLANYSDFFRSV